MLREHKSKALFLARRRVIVMFCAVLWRGVGVGEGAPSAGLEERGMVALETLVSDRAKESDGKTDGTDELHNTEYRTAGVHDKHIAGCGTVERWMEK